MGQMFYIDMLRTPSFPIGMVQLNLALSLDQLKSGLGRWTLVVAVISVVAYPFLAISNLPVTLKIRE